MTNGGTRHYAADEIVAPALIALKAWYDEARGSKSMAAFDTLPPPHELPGPADLALIEVAGVHELFGEVQARGASVIKPLGERPWAAVDFYVEDADGYILCFSESNA